MKFKERLWQLFLAIVLGVTLSVCDAGLQDDELESSALIAGSAIAAGVTSGDDYVKIGNYMILSGKETLTSNNKTKIYTNVVFGWVSSEWLEIVQYQKTQWNKGKEQIKRNKEQILNR